MNKSGITSLEMTSVRTFSSIQYIPGLDGARAIAVLLVILHHYLMPFSIYMNAHPIGELLGYIAKIGWIGVDLFFVISGFLITQVMLKRPISSWREYRQFIHARAWRLLPAYIACLLAFTWLALEFSPNSKALSNSLSLWTLTSNLQSAFINRTALMDDHFNLVHFWSLAVEWHFYLIVPILFWMLRSFVMIAFVLILIALLTRMLLQNTGASDNAIYAFSLCRFDAFGIGILLALHKDKLTLKRVNITGIIGVITGFTLMYFIAANPVPFKRIEWLQLYGYTLISLTFAMMLLPLVNNHDVRKCQLLSHPLLINIGQKSYSLYIWHLVFLPFTINAIANLKLNPMVTIGLIVTTMTLLSFICTYISYHLIEKKGYQFYHRSIKKTIY